MLNRLGNVICYASYAFAVLCIGLALHDPRSAVIGFGLALIAVLCGQAVKYVLGGK